MNNGDVGGSRGRGRGWQQPENQPRELRRPKIVGEDAKVEAPKSNLSAEAKEWYPPNYTPQTYAADPAPYRPQRFSVQDRLRQAQDQNPYNFDSMSYSLEEAENMDLRENIGNLITVMCEITFDPGKFDTLCGPLVDSFASMLHERSYTRALIDAIVNQSIGEPNFRYNGARLCSMYDSVAPPEESTFRACLLERCSAEENKIITGLEGSEENVRGFAMFLAEIYTQLEDSQGGRIRSLGESLCKVLLHLLDTDNEPNIKSVCQLLKLSGIALDADCPGGMHAMFERLKRRAALPAVRAVLALRQGRWGLAEPTRVGRVGTVSNGDGAGAGDGGYLADGHSLTAEECAFLQSNLPPKSAALEEDILEELENEAWDTGMDAEMQAGFLEFLKMSNQINR
ncbi:polyadenylate-binding protein-interacting protein 1 isoform X4 [Leguminivora glycinivorella]|uniref:polyadenylate-binding protein-interacting protein 1 isoform X3 n=1 Tax=Leguminivora glycinivorella TaxID=1035111 RepID=UPI00200F5651|nr:polyadenylate-binding protein-interacting protein 1 isoform X3 [Leguminivora glycinivorella]XP_047985901.1 polyadenylate-binding protein-interacting protein 1 isoform X4 [Leguminivora glycinivorella]